MIKNHVILVIQENVYLKLMNAKITSIKFRGFSPLFYFYSFYKCSLIITLSPFSSLFFIMQIFCIYCFIRVKFVSQIFHELHYPHFFFFFYSDFLYTLFYSSKICFTNFSRITLFPFLFLFLF